MKVWIAHNGWLGETSIGCLVEAESEEEARLLASAAFAWSDEGQSPNMTPDEKRSCATVQEIEEIELPWVGEIA